MKSSIKRHLSEKFIVLLIAFFVIAGCQQQTDYSKELKPLVDIYNSAWETGNTDGFEDIYHPDFVRHSDASTSAQNLEELIKIIKDFHTAYSDKKLVSEEEIYTKDKFVGRWTYTVTHTGPGEIPPTGKTVKLWGINIIHFKDGKIIEEWDAFDNLSYMEQLGYSIVPPSDSEE
jgi:predicted ester cyclase